MERFAAIVNSVSAFVNWEEVSFTNHRGRKEVRYYLKRRDGTSDLAVVGKEKNSGHMKTTLSSSYRYRFAIRDESLFPSLNLRFKLPSKLRSRSEVIVWLNSFVTDGSVSASPQPLNRLSGARATMRSSLEKFEDTHLQNTNRHSMEFIWVGSAWICKKKRKHYKAYTCSGVKISVQDFVYVLAEEGKRLVAYINDLYEDLRGKKTAVVQWFHKIDEVNLYLPHTYNNNKEIFFSLSLQDLSIECIDGLATVLSPQHYNSFLKLDSYTNLNPFVCRNQFDDEVVKPFDITQVKGYWNQCIHRFMSHDHVGIRPLKRLRRLVDSESNSHNRNLREYTIGSEIEVLSQDSGIRGVWFKAVVIKKHKDKLKVRYQDLKDARDESINLEEWILSTRVALADEMGIRLVGRMTIRPSRLLKKIDVCLFDVGCIVDAWLHDGWWEGIVVHKESDDRIHVYFPGEKQQSIFSCKDLRYSQEWFGDEWKQMKNRPDVLGSISCVAETNSQITKSNDNLSSDLCSDQKENSQENKDFEMVHNCHSKEELLAHLNWHWSTRKRHNDSVSAGTRKQNGFTMPVSVKVDHESCKFMCPPVASPLTSLVMSR